jgi:hypothetical protein
MSNISIYNSLELRDGNTAVHNYTTLGNKPNLENMVQSKCLKISSLIENDNKYLLNEKLDSSWFIQTPLVFARGVSESEFVRYTK